MPRTPERHDVEIFNIVKSRGSDGITIKQLQEELTVSYVVARRYLATLAEKGLLTVEYDKMNNNQAWYYAASSANLIPSVPHWHKDQPPIPLDALVSKLAVTNPDEQQQTQMTKRLGLYLLKLIQFAADWEKGIEVPIQPVRELRYAMEQAKARALWQANALATVLNDARLWDKSSAPTIWFSDPEHSFSVTKAEELMQAAVAWFSDAQFSDQAPVEVSVDNN